LNRKEAEDFIYSSYLRAAKHQDYAAKDRDKRHPELTKDIIEALSGNKKARQLLVTGSKGKGSVSRMLCSLLKDKMKIGLFTSPHIVEFTERFQVGEDIISDSLFATLMTELAPKIKAIDEALPEDIGISPMGIETALALTYFEREQTEFNILECGKGAKYDDVNNALHQYAVINPIFPEHLRELGDSIEEIAEDKSHVITKDVKTVFIGKQDPGVLEILLKRAEAMGAEAKVYGRDFSAEQVRFTESGILFDVVVGSKRFSDLELPIPALYQAENCAVAVAAMLKIIEDCKDIFGSEEDSHDGTQNDIAEVTDSIRSALRDFHIYGRMEIISKKPWILLDACINKKSFSAVKEALDHLNINKAEFIIGIPDDKDYFGVAESAKNMAARIFLVDSGNPHYVFTKKQQEHLEENGISAIWKKSPEAAIADATTSGLPIVILGTTSLITRIKTGFNGCDNSL